MIKYGKPKKRRSEGDAADNGIAASLFMLGLASVAYGGAKAVQFAREYKAKMLQAVSSGEITAEQAQDIQQSVAEVQDNGGAITPEVAQKAQQDYGVPAEAISAVDRQADVTPEQLVGEGTQDAPQTDVAEEQAQVNPEQAAEEAVDNAPKEEDLTPVTPLVRAVQEAAKEEQEAPAPVIPPTTPVADKPTDKVIRPTVPTPAIQEALRRANQAPEDDTSSLASALTGLGAASYLGGKGALGAEKAFKTLDNFVGNPVVLNYADPKVQEAMNLMERLADPEYDPTNYTDDYTRAGGILSGQKIRMKDKTGRTIYDNIGGLNHTLQEKLIDMAAGIKNDKNEIVQKGIVTPGDLKILERYKIPFTKGLEEKLNENRDKLYDYHHNRTSLEHYRRFGEGEDGGRRALARELDEYRYGAKGWDPLRRSGLRMTDVGGAIEPDPDKRKSVVGILSRNMIDLPYRRNSWFKLFSGLTIPKKKAVNVNPILEQIAKETGLTNYVLDPNIGDKEKYNTVYKRILQHYGLNEDDPRSIEEYVDNVADRQYLKEKGFLPDEKFDLRQLEDPNKVKELLKDPKRREWLVNKFNKYIDEVDPAWAKQKSRHFGYFDEEAANRRVAEIKKQIADINNQPGSKKQKRIRIKELADEIRGIEKARKLDMQNASNGFKVTAQDEIANRMLEKRFRKDRRDFTAYDKLMLERIKNPAVASAVFDGANVASNLDRDTRTRVKTLLDSMNPEEREAALRDVKFKHDKQMQNEALQFRNKLKAFVKEKGLGGGIAAVARGSIGTDATGTSFFRGADVTGDMARPDGSPLSYTDDELANNAKRFIDRDLQEVRKTDKHRFGRAMRTDPLGQYAKMMSGYLMQDTAKIYGGISKFYKGLEKGRELSNKYHGAASGAVKGGLAGIGLGALLAGDDQKWQTLAAGSGIGAMTGAQLGAQLGLRASDFFGSAGKSTDLNAKLMKRLSKKVKLLRPVAGVASALAKTDGIKKLVGKGLMTTGGLLAGGAAGTGAGALGSNVLFNLTHADANTGIGGALGALAGAYGGAGAASALHDSLQRGGSLSNKLQKAMVDASKTDSSTKLTSDLRKLVSGKTRAQGIENLRLGLGRALSKSKGTNLGKGLKLLASSGALKKVLGTGAGAVGGGLLGAGAGALTEALQPGGGSTDAPELPTEF